MGRQDLCRDLLCDQMAFKFVNAQCAIADLDELTGEDADHAAKEAVGRNAEADPVAAGVGKEGG